MVEFHSYILVLSIFIVKKGDCDQHFHDDSLLVVANDLGFKGKNSRPYAEDSAFSAYWNIPTIQCLNEFGIDIPLDQFGITANADGNITGEALVLFPQLGFGLYPHFNKTTKEPVNGGLPQLANLTLHLEKAAQDVVSAIPNATFSGLAVFDWELWHPLWERQSGGIYAQKSLDSVKRRHPDWDASLIELVARVEYEESAKSFMESTLSLVQRMRPNARLGFYHYPSCLNMDTESSDCNPEAVSTNDKITWLFSESTVLYPSIYLHGSKHDFRGYAKSNIKEALRVRKLSNVPHVPIFAYTRFNYSHSGLYYTKEDLNNTILQAAELGTNGVVFWGDHNDTSSLQSCVELQGYLNMFLGPFVEEVITAASRCSGKVCSGHGRCVGDITQCASESRVFKVFTRRKNDSEQSSQCTCSCYKGWEGEACGVHSNQGKMSSAPAV